MKVQVAASYSSAGPFGFVGPDGTSGTYFTSSGASLAQFDGLRYVKVRAVLATTDAAATPTLADVTVCFSNSCSGFARGEGRKALPTSPPPVPAPSHFRHRVGTDTSRVSR